MLFRSESGEHRQPLAADRKRKLLSRLTAVETLERFLHKAYLGQKRFSIEGLDALVPILDQTVELAGASGARRVVLGVAHRGRLNVLATSWGCLTRPSSPSSRAGDTWRKRSRPRVGPVT